MNFYKTNKLLSVSADAKTIKGEKQGILTGVLYLAPFNNSGFQVCPKATEGCAAACLYTAGRGVYTQVQDARINKTHWFFLDRDSFMAQIVDDIKAIIRKAERTNMTPAIRLNGTSDIAWEKIKVLKDGKTYASIMEAFPNVMFYDYTKILGRKKALKLQNYHLTFSLSESNDKEAIKALAQGYNVAVVMDLRRKEAKPSFWSGHPVIDGDVSDVRFKDASGHIVGLYKKGRARYDESGFVRKPDGKFRA